MPYVLAGVQKVLHPCFEDYERSQTVQFYTHTSSLQTPVGNSQQPVHTSPLAMRLLQACFRGQGKV